IVVESLTSSAVYYINSLPYTTRFRSALVDAVRARLQCDVQKVGDDKQRPFLLSERLQVSCDGHLLLGRQVLFPQLDRADPRVQRSEEHTSELQSRENLVCRLLLENNN